MGTLSPLTLTIACTNESWESQGDLQELRLFILMKTIYVLLVWQVHFQNHLGNLLLCFAIRNQCLIKCLLKRFNHSFL